MPPPTPLPVEALRRVCDPASFPFDDTSALDPSSDIIGQPRGTRAIEFGVGIRSQGYNIFVLGETGTGRVTAIRRFLQKKTAGEPVPPDWVYVYNFAVPHQPTALRFAPGGAVAFKNDLDSLLSCLREDLPRAFDTEEYHEAIEAIDARFEEQQSTVLAELQTAAREEGFALLRRPSGMDIAPVVDGAVMSPEQFQALPAETQQQLDRQRLQLGARLDEAFFRIRQLETTARQEVEALNREVARTALAHVVANLRERYEATPAVLAFLNAAFADVLDNVRLFVPDDEREETVDLLRYQVNVLVDNIAAVGIPVIFEPNPNYANLIGRIEYEMVYGAMTTHFTNIKAGSLHRANGGYLVLNARDLLRHGSAWEALKRALKEEVIQLQSPDALDGPNQVMAKSLDPEPIPLQVKIILMGSPGLFYKLYDLDEDFGELFKVKADFDSVMPRTPDADLAYAHFIAGRCHEEGLPHFDRGAVARVIEHGSRLCDHQDKLSTRFGLIAGLVREAAYWAGARGAERVTAEDVRHAIAEQVYRSNEAEERIQEHFDENLIMLTTTGRVVGQVNGLAVIDLGDHSFGQPSRITAQTYMGEEGVINIDREVEMTGPLHNKGLLTLVGYLGGTYAQNQPLSLSASLSFEQNYGGVDGDSASSAELYALLSSLAGAPVDQGRAVTGSVNQRGEVQPIGGVSEKIEGFFRLCRKRGLTGDQGVLIPVGNVKHLMVDEEVVEAVRAGTFHVWAVSTIDEGVELLMDIPAGRRDRQRQYPDGSLHRRVQGRLRELAEELKQFGED